MLPIFNWIATNYLGYQTPNNIYPDIQTISRKEETSYGFKELVANYRGGIGSDIC